MLASITIPMRRKMCGLALVQAPTLLSCLTSVKQLQAVMWMSSAAGGEEGGSPLWGGGYLGTGRAQTNGGPDRFLLTGVVSFACFAACFGQLCGSHTCKILITGACGQLGSALLPFLREKVGNNNVIASDVKHRRDVLDAGPFEFADVQDQDNLSRIVVEYSINRVIHLASLLSAIGERNPPLTLKINNKGFENIMEIALQHKLQVFSPSTIAVFGTPMDTASDDAIKSPTTVYGITKVHTELLGTYYSKRFGVDFRSLRLPGIIGKAPAGGGTTDYAVDIFRAALQSKKYTCSMPEDLALPMLYMPDCLEAIYSLIMAPREQLSRTVYNVQGMSICPRELATAIAEHVPDFKFEVGPPDYRAAIAHSWPRAIDDSQASRDWGWAPKYDLQKMTQDMLKAECSGKHA